MTLDLKREKQGKNSLMYSIKQQALKEILHEQKY